MVHSSSVTPTTISSAHITPEWYTPLRLTYLFDTTDETHGKMCYTVKTVETFGFPKEQVMKSPKNIPKEWTHREDLCQTQTAILFRCAHHHTGESLLFKTYVDESISLTANQALRVEADTLKALKGQGSCELREVIEYHGRVFIVLEDIGASTLYNLQQRAPLTLEDAAHFLSALAHTLSQLHRAGWVHQQLTPQHILWHPESARCLLWGFEHAAQLGEWTEHISLPLETLAYTSPEQIKRIKRKVDRRSDYYMLGALAWHILVGHIPFQRMTPSQMVQAHLVTPPLPPHKVNPNIPQMLSEWVRKLMAKQPEQRYQSGTGLLFDLERCVEDLQAGISRPFVLGLHDVAFDVMLPGLLVGREEEMSSLLKGVEDICDGGYQIVLVSGAPGIGKSALLEALQKKLQSSSVRMVTGKFELQSGTPSHGLQNALRDLVEQIMSESLPRQLYWRAKLTKALEGKHQSLFSLLPELQHLLDETTPLPSLQPEEERIRLRTAFSLFLQTLSGTRHPLILCLDDIQWADEQTLDLIEFLSASKQHKGLMLVLSYREPVLALSHRHIRFLEYIRQQETTCAHHPLSPLVAEDIVGILQSKVPRSTRDIHSLATLLKQKSGGSPFFLGVMLRRLSEEGLLRIGQEGWEWDEAAIVSAEITENVVELLLSSLNQLPTTSKDALHLLACLGRQSTQPLLAMLLGLSQDDLQQALHPLLTQHLIAFSSTTSKVQHEERVLHFTHDRIQEAAYALKSVSEREHTHLQIGRQLLALHQAGQHEISLFDAVRHLRAAGAQLNAPQERLQLAQLAGEVGAQTRRAGAYQSTVEILEWGLGLLGPKRWQDHYDLSIKLTTMLLNVAETLQSKEALDTHTAAILQHGRTLIEQYPGWKIRIMEKILASKLDEALTIANDFFRKAGESAFKQTGTFAFIMLLLRTFFSWWRKEPADLTTIPLSQDPLFHAYTELKTILTPVFIKKGIRTTLIESMRDIHLLSRRGITPFNTQTMVGLGMFMVMSKRCFAQAEEYGIAALQSLEKTGTQEQKPGVLVTSCIGLLPYTQPLPALSQEMLRIHQLGPTLGDNFYAAVATGWKDIIDYMSGVPLHILDKQIAESRQFQRQHRISLTMQHSNAVAACLSALIAPTPPSLPHQPLEDNDAIKGIQSELYLPLFRLQLCLLFGGDGLSHIKAAQKELQAPVAALFRSPFSTYALIALYRIIQQDDSRKKEAKRLRKPFHKHLTRMVKLAPNKRMYRKHWVDGAAHAASGQPLRAIGPYAQAVEQAKQAGFLQDAALIAEDLSSVYAAVGNTKLSHMYLKEAFSMYKVWGATAKLQQLKHKHPALDTSPHEDTAQHTPGSGIHLFQRSVSQDDLDLDVLLDASNLFAQEAQLDALYAQWMRFLNQDKQLQSGLLLIHEAEHWVLTARFAQTEDDSSPIAQSVQLSHDTVDMPGTILSHVIETQAPFVSNTPQQSSFFEDSPYLLQHTPASIFCLPLLIQGQTQGILYLENRETSHVFTPERQRFVELLTTQAAICIHHLRTTPKQTASMHQQRHTPAAVAHLTPSITPQHPNTLAIESSKQLTPPSEAPSQLIDAHIGEWQILYPIGQGGMSTVYRAAHRSTGRPAALKILSPAHNTTRGRVKRFEREAQTLASLAHPNIVEIYDFDRHPQHGYFMALEYLEGQDLRALIKQCAPLPLGWILSISGPLCDALQTVHNTGIIHRDLKPSNIFLCVDDEGMPIVKLLDFGVADLQNEDTQLTTTGAIIGTPGYLAPEQLGEHKHLSPATDLYALGVIWFELLTGQHPLGHGSHIEMFVRILQEKPTLLGALRHEFAGTELELLLEQLASKEQTQRHPSATVLWDEFEMACQFIEDPLDQPERYPTLDRIFAPTASS